MYVFNLLSKAQSQLLKSLDPSLRRYNPDLLLIHTRAKVRYFCTADYNTLATVQSIAHSQQSPRLVRSYAGCLRYRLQGEHHVVGLVFKVLSGGDRDLANSPITYSSMPTRVAVSFLLLQAYLYAACLDLLSKHLCCTLSMHCAHESLKLFFAFLELNHAFRICQQPSTRIVYSRSNNPVRIFRDDLFVHYLLQTYICSIPFGANGLKKASVSA